MPDRIRFYIDEHIPAAVSSGLAQRGLDVLTAQRANRAGVGDIDQLVFARDEQRVFVTFDSDFLRSLILSVIPESFGVLLVGIRSAS